MADPTPNPAPSPAPAPAPAGDPPAAFDWGKNGLAGDDLGFVGNKGWKTPGDMLLSYRAAEKLLHAPAESYVLLPKEDKPENWAPVYDRLGRPKTAAEYKLPVPEGGDPKFAESASGWFHEAGLSAKQAQALAVKWNEHATGAMAAQKQALAVRDTEQATALKTEWGVNYDANVQAVDKAAKAFGMTPDHLNALRQAMGPQAAMKFMHNIGSRLGAEGNFVAGNARDGVFPGGSTDEAKARIKELRGDKGFIAKFVAGDVQARDEMKRLHQLAYPGETVL